MVSSLGCKPNASGCVGSTPTPYTDSLTRDKSRTLLGYVIWLKDYLKLLSIEGKHMYASQSEVRRWIKSGSVLINGERPTDFDHVLTFPITELILFPKGKRKCTLL